MKSVATSLLSALLGGAILGAGCSPAEPPAAEKPAVPATAPGTPPALNARGEAPPGTPPAGMPPANVSKETFAKMERDVAEIEKSGDKKKIAEAKVQLGEAIMQTDRSPREMYPAALKLFREAKALDPSNKDADKWIGTIEEIYASLGRKAPQ